MNSTTIANKSCETIIKVDEWEEDAVGCNLEKLVDFQGLFFRGEILRERLEESHQKESAFETLAEDGPVVPEVVPGQIATGFARRHRRYDEDRVL